MDEAANEVAGDIFTLLPPFLRVFPLRIYREGILFNECGEMVLNSLIGESRGGGQCRKQDPVGKSL